MFAYLLGRMDWPEFFRLKAADAEDVVWIRPATLRETLAYLREMHMLIYDLAMVRGLMDGGKHFCIRRGLDIGGLRGKRVHVNLSRDFNPFGYADYTRSLFGAIKRLEADGNTVFPSYEEARLWENKEYMHRRFSELGIPHPETVIVRAGDPLPVMAFPLLFKEVHSAGSSGVYRVDDRRGLEERARKSAAAGNEAFLLQKLVNMRSDLRVTIIGGEIVLHYWRRNLSAEWRPTSTGRGSAVDFGNFPEQWRGFILENFRKLGIRTGAFDITWQNDDTAAQPLFLEVSPVYQPNPAPPPSCAGMPYSAYKKRIFARDSYFVKYIDIIFWMKRKLYALYRGQRPA